MDINISTHTRNTAGTGLRDAHAHQAHSLQDYYEEEVIEEEESVQESVIEQRPALRPNPNLRKPEPVQAIVQEQVVEAEETDLSSDKYVVRDLQDLLEENPRVDVTTRLLVKLMFTEPSYIDLADSAVNDIKNVETMRGKDLNFYSPFAIAESDGAAGFMRRPLIDLIKHLSSSNARDHYALTDSAAPIEKMIKQLNKEVTRLVFNHFGPGDVVTYLTEEDDDEVSIEDRSYLAASDFVSVDTWNSYSFANTGAINVNYNVSLAIHPLEIYEIEDKLKYFNRIKKLILKIVTKMECETLTIALAAVFDVQMLAYPEYRKFIDGFFPKEINKEVVETGFDYMTSSTIEFLADEKEDAISTLEEDSAESWSESDEIYPSKREDVSTLIKSSELMFITTLVENIDTISDEDEDDD